jgi:predicted negative regulator of RcsB-dependent stress response
MKAKERHELKQDEFAATAIRVAGQLRENQSRILTIVGAVVLVAVAGSGFYFWKQGQEDKAGVLLGEAYAIGQSAIAPPSTLPGAVQAPNTFPTELARGEATIKAFQQVLSNYPSSSAAVAAAYEIAATQLELGRFSDAEAGFNKVVAEKQEPYSSTARLGLAQTLLAEGKNDAALKLLTDLSAERDGPLPVDSVLVQLARANVKAGKTADARAAYKRVVDEFADSQYAADARQALAAMN